MFPRIEIGRIAGIAIYLDMMFVLVLLLFTYPYFTSGNTQMMSAGFIIVIGLLLSILLHELGHAFAGRLFNARVSHIDLTGIGGVAHFERSLPAIGLRALRDLSGRARGKLGLWLGLGALAGEAAGRQPDGGTAAGRAGLGQLRADELQSAASLSARRRPYARRLARRHPRASLVGAHRRQARPGGRRRRRPLRPADRLLHAAYRLLPGPSQLGSPAERRRLSLALADSDFRAGFRQ